MDDRGAGVFLSAAGHCRVCPLTSSVPLPKLMSPERWKSKSADGLVVKLMKGTIIADQFFGFKFWKF